MKTYINTKLFGNVLSDGSFIFMSSAGYNYKQSLNVDILNHPVWTGRRPKEQTEISAFISRFGIIDVNVQSKKSHNLTHASKEVIKKEIN